MTCDLLVVAPHPDDAEIHCGGTIARHVRLGARVVVVDATAGELGSRGSAEERAREAAAAAHVLGLAKRECLGLPDGYLAAGDPGQRDVVVRCLRRWRPGLVLSIAEPTRHPDHQALAGLVGSALKAAALHRLPGMAGLPAVPDLRCLRYEGELPILADLLVPLSEDDWQCKLAAVRCYGSQLHRPGAPGPATSISRPGFADWITARARAWGHQAGVTWAEAFQAPEAPVVADLRLLDN